MATLYNLEPPPTAKVVLTTTAGEVLLELFAKQTPLASRSFLQHCLDGYYDGTVFHRLVPGFIIQGGDPTNTGEGGESIYPGRTFEDEFHTRLKWNRRGLLGMANEGRKNTNGSQFFLSLGDCKELEGRNTMFGRVVGDTIFNLLKMADAEIGEGERPLYPTKIVSTEVLVNPYEDMVRQEVKKVEVAEEKKAPPKKSKRKLSKTILSFEDDEEGESAAPVKKEKLNPRLADSDLQASPGLPSKSNGVSQAAPRINASQAKSTAYKRRRSSPSRSPPPMKKPAPAAQLPIRDEERPSRSASSTPEPVEKMTSLLEKTNAQIAEMKASMKRNVSAPSQQEKPKSALEAMMPATAMRGKKRKAPEKQTLDLLTKFKSKLEGAKASSKTVVPEHGAHPEADMTNGKVGQDDEDEAALCDLHFIADCESCKSWDENVNEDADDNDDKAWMSHTLSFEKDRLGKDLTYRKKKLEELVVIDPREKAQDIMGEEKARNRARMEGKGRTAWKRDGGRGG